MASSAPLLVEARKFLEELTWQVSSGAFIGTAALAAIAVFHVLRMLLHAAHDALFATYVFPHDCSSYTSVSRWLAGRPEVAKSSAVLQFYDPSNDEGYCSDDYSGKEDEDADAKEPAEQPDQIVLPAFGAGYANQAQVLRTRPLPGASVVLRLASTRVWVSRHAPPKEQRRSRRYERRSRGGGRRDRDDDGSGDEQELDNARAAVHLTMLRAYGPRVLTAVLAGAAAAGDADGGLALGGGTKRPSSLKHQTATLSDDGEYWGWGTSNARVVSLRELVGLDGAAEVLLADTKRFLASERWYAARGIPYRRGYLLHGPSGCGKRALALALAAELELDVYSVDLCHAGMTDEGLATLFRYVGARSIMLLRRVDRAFDEHGQPCATTPKGLTFSALLNVCDGVNASRDGALVFFTSERDHTQLDPALARPGRMDKRCPIPAPDAAAGAAFFRRFYANHPLHSLLPEQLAALAEDFKAALERRLAKEPVSMRAVVSFLTTRTPQRAIDTIQELGLDALQVAARSGAGGGNEL